MKWFNSRFRGLPLGGLVVLTVCGCTHRFASFSVVSTRPVSYADFDFSKAMQRSRQVEGRSEAQIIVVVPTARPTLEGAIENALAQGGGDLILNATAYQHMWYIPYVYGKQAWVVTGHVVNSQAETSLTRSDQEGPRRR